MHLSYSNCSLNLWLPRFFTWNIWSDFWGNMTWPTVWQFLNTLTIQLVISINAQIGRIDYCIKNDDDVDTVAKHANDDYHVHEADWSSTAWLIMTMETFADCDDFDDDWIERIAGRECGIDQHKGTIAAGGAGGGGGGGWSMNGAASNTSAAPIAPLSSVHIYSSGTLGYKRIHLKGPSYLSISGVSQGRNAGRKVSLKVGRWY